MGRFAKAFNYMTEKLKRDGKKSGQKYSDAASPLREISPYVVTICDPSSRISEEYRKLKSRVLRLTQRSGKSVLLVTSSLGGEGKSLTAINLAVSLSEERDSKVILMDTDLRNPSLSGFFDVTPEAGFSDCIAGEAGIEDALLNVKERLFLLAAKAAHAHPTSSAMREFMYELRRLHADSYIIIDAPPVLPFAETHMMSALVDGTIFVVREGVSTPADISTALSILGEGSVLGIVYNDARHEDSEKHYYRYYSEMRKRKARYERA